METVSRDAASEIEAPPPTVFDLLARSWDAGGEVIGVVVDASDRGAAFLMRDGTVKIASMQDPEPAASRVRVAGDVGHMSILQRTQPFGPLAEANLLPGERTALVACLAGRGFVVGTRDGALKRLTLRGQLLDMSAPFQGPVTALCGYSSATSLVAACGADLAVVGEGESEPVRRLRAPSPVVDASVSPCGRHIGVATEAGLWLVPMGEGSPTLVPFSGLSGPLSWSPDSAFLAAGLREPGMVLFRLADSSVHAITQYPAVVRSIVWSAPAKALATSGAFRAVAWAMTAPPVDGDVTGALLAGRTGLVLVERLAAHPHRPLLAVGYANGIVALANVGTKDEMVMCAEEGPAVTGLAFTSDGSNLAVSHAGGKVAIIGLPEQLFK